MGTEYIVEFDETKCVACHGCVVACKSWRGVPLGVRWRRMEKLWSGNFPDVRLRHASVSCQHCVEPACLNACPTGSIVKSALGGRVTVNGATCIGCRACLEACPFGVPAFGQNGLMQKCDLCFGRDKNADGQTPCAATCPTQALRFKEISPAKKAGLEKKLRTLLQNKA